MENLNAQINETIFDKTFATLGLVIAQNGLGPIEKNPKSAKGFSTLIPNYDTRIVALYEKNLTTEIQNYHNIHSMKKAINSKLLILNAYENLINADKTTEGNLISYNKLKSEIQSLKDKVRVVNQAKKDEANKPSEFGEKLKAALGI